MKRAVMLSILNLLCVSLPGMACDSKECAHNKCETKSHAHHKKAVNEASKPAVEKKVEAAAETKIETK